MLGKEAMPLVKDFQTQEEAIKLAFQSNQSGCKSYEAAIWLSRKKVKKNNKVIKQCKQKEKLTKAKKKLKSLSI